MLKVLDFGISKAAQGALDHNLTATSVVMGTPTYMSPEQVKSTRDVDRRSDIWSLGIVLYELFQGTPPFVAETFGSMAIKVATEQLPPLSGQLPPGLADIVYRCLQKDPALRFQNIAELSYALAPYAQSTAKSSALGGAYESRARYGAAEVDVDADRGLHHRAADRRAGHARRSDASSRHSTTSRRKRCGNALAVPLRETRFPRATRARAG